MQHLVDIEATLRGLEFHEATNTYRARLEVATVGTFRVPIDVGQAQALGRCMGRVLRLELHVAGDDGGGPI